MRKKVCHDCSHSIVENYIKEVEKNFGDLDPVVLMYGSSLKSIGTSDLDTCMILHNYTDEQKKQFKDLIINFHKKYDMSLDDEVPFEQKCIYSYFDIEKMLQRPPFPIHRGKFYIPPINKSSDYLASDEVKFRLLLNILTTRSILLKGNEKIMDVYRRRAWDVLIRIMYSYVDNNPLTVSQFVNYLCKNPFGEEEGEYFLGYNAKDSYLVEHLHKCCEDAFCRLNTEEKMIFSKDLKAYCCDQEWLNLMQINAAASYFPDSSYYQMTNSEKMKGYDFSENANPLGPTKSVEDAIKQSSPYVSIYPDYKNIDANNCLARFFSVEVDNVAVANGSLEAIFAIPNLLDTSAPVIVSPTYWGYEAALNAKKVNYSKLYLDSSLEFDTVSINKAASEASMMYICNPNNPTSSYISKDKILNIIESNKSCHFIIDESHLMLHHDFFEETLSKHVQELGNVSIVYSLSKLFSVAGLRIGALVSNTELIDQYKKWQVPYSLSTISQMVLPICINDTQFVAQTRDRIHVLVQNLYKDLCKFSWLKVKPSRTNFILCEITRGISAVELANRLRQDGFYIRELTTCYSDLKGEWIRISVNTEILNRRLIDKIKSYNIE